VWAQGGEGTSRATLYWAPFSLSDGVSAWAGSTTVEVPYPERQFTRDITDVFVDRTNRVWVASAWDDGSAEGPFRSAIYLLGVIEDCTTPGGFRAFAEPVLVRRFPTRKVEGLTVDDQLVCASDDEAHGGWIFASCVDDLCPPGPEW
jgi:hypothetical protein